MTADLMCGRPRACPSSCAATSLKWVPRPHQPGDSTQSSSPADTWISIHCGPRGSDRKSQLYEHLFFMFWASN